MSGQSRPSGEEGRPKDTSSLDGRALPKMLKIYCQCDYEVYSDVGLLPVMAPGGDQEARPRSHPFLLALQDFPKQVSRTHFVPTFAVGCRGRRTLRVTCRRRWLRVLSPRGAHDVADQDCGLRAQGEIGDHRSSALTVSANPRAYESLSGVQIRVEGSQPHF